jgi:hypothetical protein
VDGPAQQDGLGPEAARGSDAIHGRMLASAAVTRVLTLVVSGIPTMLAWAIMSKKLGAVDFSGVSLALTLPTLSSFILPAMGARIANAAAIGRPEFEDAVARSVRACLLAGGILIAVSAAVSAYGWSRVLGRPTPDPFPMDGAVVFVSVAIAVWIVLLIGERILIARGEVTKRVLANAVTGPATLLGVLVVAFTHGPAWAYVLPLPLAMLAAACCSLAWCLRLPGISWRTVYGNAWHRPAHGFGRSSLALWLVVVEASVLIPVWLLRPVVSVRGTDADVASLSVALQFATPVFSVLAVIGQGLWPFYARHRHTLARRDVMRHVGAMGAASAGLAACYAAGLWLLFHLDLVGHRAGSGVLLAMAVTIVARGCWEPVRIVFSTDRTSRGFAGLCVTSCVVAVAWMWPVGGVAHGVLAVLGVAAAFAADSLLSPVLLMGRLRPADAEPVR